LAAAAPDDYAFRPARAGDLPMLRIGDPDMLGRGHGSAFLRRLAERLVAEGAPIVAIDPDVDNLRARRAYARAGFVEQGGDRRGPRHADDLQSLEPVGASARSNYEEFTPDFASLRLTTLLRHNNRRGAAAS
jgi:RimJ/RimL family protein N-acetyltransferase